MGQYYLLVNEDRQEYISPHQVGCGAKLWEICANDLPRVTPYLLYQSSRHGGGDPFNQPTNHLGRWAGDRIVVIGNYDRSELYQTPKQPTIRSAMRSGLKSMNSCLRSSSLMSQSMVVTA